MPRADIPYADTTTGVGDLTEALTRGPDPHAEVARPAGPTSRRPSAGGGPMAGAVETLKMRAARNALPPSFGTPFEAPGVPWRGQDSVGSWLLGAGLYSIGWLASVGYFTAVWTLWAVLHMFMWLVGHPLRFFPTVAAGAGAAYFLLLH